MAIKGKDLFQDDGALEKAIQDLEAMDKAYSKMQKNIQANAKKLEKDIRRVSGSSGEARKATQEQANAAAALEKEQNKLSAAMGENAKRLAELREAKKEQARINRLEAKMNAAAEGSYQRLSAQYSLNKMELNKMSKAQRENTKRGRELVKTTKAQYEEMKRLQEETGKHSLNVGNYKESMRELANEMDNMPGILGQVRGGVQGVSTAFKALLANPVVAVLGLIVGALGALFEGFRRSESGAALFNRAAGVAQGVLSSLSRIATEVGKRLSGAMKDPLGAVESLGRSILENVVNRFKGLVQLVGVAGRAIQALANRDFSALKKSGKELQETLIQISTGLDVEGQKELSGALKEQRKAIEETASAFADLYDRQRAVRRENAELAKGIENLRTQQQLALQLQEDDTRGFKERTEAAREARQLTIQLAQQELKVAKNNLGVLNEEIRLRRANNEDVLTLMEERVNAIREVADAERELLVGLEEGDELRRRLFQDAKERELDILIDGLANTQAINTQIINDNRRPLEERKKMLAETEALAASSFARQIAVVQEFTDEAVDANALLAESDAQRQFEMIRALGLSEIMEGRLLEVIRDRKTAVIDFEMLRADLDETAMEAMEAKADKAEETAKREFDAVRDSIEKQAEVRTSEIDAMQATEEEKTALRLDAERERLKAILDLYENSTGQITQADKDIVRNQIQAIDNEIQAATAASDGVNLYDVFGINVGGGEQEAIGEAIDYAKGKLQEWMALRQQAADQAVQNSDREVQAAQQALNAELKKAELGYASNVERADAELELQRKNQRKALERQKRTQRENLAIQSVQQAANLITASTKILSEFGMPFGLIPLGLMWGTFAAAKVKAFQETQFGSGGFEAFDYAGSHASGNDIPLGMTKDGKLRKVERGEGMGIFSRKAMAQYGGMLPGLTSAINSGNLEGFVSKMGGSKFHGMLSVAAGVDTSRMERELKTIRRQGEEQIYTDSLGRVVVKRGNQRRIYE